jgi:hypothetical protein
MVTKTSGRIFASGRTREESLFFSFDWIIRLWSDMYYTNISFIRALEAGSQ